MQRQTKAFNADMRVIKKRWWFALANVSVGDRREQVFLAEYLSMLINSGLSITDSLLSIQQEVKQTSLKYVLQQMRFDVEAGLPFYEAAGASNIFNERSVALIRLGENAGNLPEYLDTIVDQVRQEAGFKSRIRSAMMYPVFVLAVTSIVGIGMAWFILPMLADTFSRINTDLPLITRIVLGAGRLLQDYGSILVPSFILGVLLSVYFLFIFPKTRFIGQGMLFKLPGIGTLIQEVEVGRFGYIAGSLLEAGIPVVDAFKSLHGSSTFYAYRNFYLFCHYHLEQGDSFRDIFDEYKRSEKVIPPSIQHMIVTAEQSGNLPKTFEHVGRVYEQKTKTTTKNLSVILEPALLIMVWGGVLVLGLAIFLPIYGLLGSVSESGGSASSPTVQSSTRPPAPTVLGIVENPFEAPHGPEIIAPTFLRIQSPVGFLRVRSEATTESLALSVLNNGEIVEWLFKQNDWYFIQFEDRSVGWLYGAYVEEIEE